MKPFLISATSIVALLTAAAGPARAWTVTASPNPLTITDLVGDGSATAANDTATVNTLSGTSTNTLSWGSIASSATNGSFASTGSTTTTFTAATGSLVGTFNYTATQVGTSAATIVATDVSGGVTQATTTLNLTGIGVAPIEQATAPATTYVRLGTSGSTAVTVRNIGNGNLSGKGAVSNLNGTASSSVLTGGGFTPTFSNGAAISLADSGSTTLGFTYAPGTSRAANTATVTASFSNGNAAGNNAAQVVTTSVTAQGVGPTVKTAIGTTVNTPTPVANGGIASTGPGLGFATLSPLGSKTINLTISNTSTDPGGPSLTNLSIEKFTITGASGYTLTVNGTAVGAALGTVIAEGASVILPITLTAGSNPGLLNGTLTLYTDEGSALGGTGDTFTYKFGFASVPEPGTLALLATGILSLMARRRRRFA